MAQPSGLQDALGILEAVEQVKDLLTLKGFPNGGVAVTDDLKYNGIPLSIDLLSIV